VVFRYLLVVPVEIQVGCLVELVRMQEGLEKGLVGKLEEPVRQLVRTQEGPEKPLAEKLEDLEGPVKRLAEILVVPGTQVLWSWVARRYLLGHARARQSEQVLGVLSLVEAARPP
jgi:hypothetical protein